MSAIVRSSRYRVGDLVMKRTGGNFQGEFVELSQITVTIDNIDDIDETAAIIETLLKKYHDKDDYAVVVPKELLRQAERTRAMFNVLLVVIAGISLLVGGIGIMNIMLATVTERTREIGIRRALGATRWHIIQQFLIETVVLTASGGLLGVLFGLSCGPLFRSVRTGVTLLSPDLLPPVIYTLEPRIAPWSVALSLFISLGVGLVFGLYPAPQPRTWTPSKPCDMNRGGPMNQDTRSYRILLVEDDARLASMVADFLAPHGFDVSIEGRGDLAIDRIPRENPDAIVLDVNLPGLDGFSICKMVRSRYRGAIIMLTARGEELDEVLGLEAGADDYMAKPVRPRALLARLRSHLRRATPAEQASPPIRVGGAGRGCRPAERRVERPADRPDDGGIRPAEPPGATRGKNAQPA